MAGLSKNRKIWIVLAVLAGTAFAGPVLLASLYFIKILLRVFAENDIKDHLWLAESFTLWAFVYAFYADIKVTEQPASLSHRVNYWEAAGALLVASMKANFIIGCFYGLNLSLPPSQIIESALYAPLFWGPMFFLFGTFTALPAILVGAGILTYLSKFKLGIIKRYQIILALGAISAIYSLIVYDPNNGFVSPLFLIGAALAGFFVRLPYLLPLPSLLSVLGKTGPNEQGRQQKFQQTVWLAALGLTIAFGVYQTRSALQQTQHAQMSGTKD